jgi:hypothetical protein
MKIMYVRPLPLKCKRASFCNAGGRTYIQLKITGAMKEGSNLAAFLQRIPFQPHKF